MTKKRFKRVTLCFTEEEHTNLKKWAHFQEISVSEMIRKALSLVISDKVAIKVSYRDKGSIAKSS